MRQIRFSPSFLVPKLSKECGYVRKHDTDELRHASDSVPHYRELHRSGLDSSSPPSLHLARHDGV